MCTDRLCPLASHERFALRPTQHQTGFMLVDSGPRCLKPILVVASLDVFLLEAVGQMGSAAQGTDANPFDPSGS